MSFTTVLLYAAAFGLWAISIRRDGGIGIGVRFLFGLNVSLFYLVGPLLAAVLSPAAPAVAAPLEPAIQLSLYGLLAYLTAAYWVYPKLIAGVRLPPSKFRAFLADPDKMQDLRAAGGWLFAVGAVSVLFNPFVFSFSYIRGGWSEVNCLADSGTLFLCLSAIGKRRYSLIAVVLGLYLGLTLFTVAISGHIGFQFLKFGFLICFVFLCGRFTARSVAVVLCCGVLSVVPYQQWLVGRNQLRLSIQEGASLDQRVAITVQTFIDLSRTSMQPEEVVGRYQIRGDYSDLLAAAMQHTPSQQPFAYGTTLLEAFVAVIPRALWPDKPYQAGSNQMITRYTGLSVSTNVSVAAGLPFELYVNFGTGGAVVGMFLLGLMLSWLERAYYESAGRNRWGELTVTLSMWTLGVQADTFALAAAGVCMAAIVAWAAARLMDALGAKIRRPRPGNGPPSGLSS